MNRAKKLIRRLDEQFPLCLANCQHYNLEGNVCETGAVRATVPVGGQCPFTSRWDSHQVTCPHYTAIGMTPDRRHHV